MKKLEKLSLENIEILSEQETMYLMGGDGSDSTYVAPRDTTTYRPPVKPEGGRTKHSNSVHGSFKQTPTGYEGSISYGHKWDFPGGGSLSTGGQINFKNGRLSSGMFTVGYTW